MMRGYREIRFFILFSPSHRNTPWITGNYQAVESLLTFQVNYAIFYVVIRLTEVELTTGSIIYEKADRLGRMSGLVCGLFLFTYFRI